MRLLEIELENFMSYAGVHRLPLDNLGLAHIRGQNLDDPGSDSNGSGKTTILEAVTWCLFGAGLPRCQGNSERGVQADEVIPDGKKGQVRVTVRLQDELTGQHVTVARWRRYKAKGRKRTSGVAIQEDDKTVEYLDAPEANKHIRQVLGMDRDIWIRSVVFGQESQFNFCEATAKERAEILTTVMGLEEVDRWLGRCRAERTKLRETLARAQGADEQLEIQLAAARAEDPQPRIEAWEEEKRMRLAEAEAWRAQVEGYGKQVFAELAKVPAPEPLGEEPPAESSDLRQRHLVAAAEVTRRERELAAVRGQLSKLQAFHEGGECPTCGQVIQEAHKRACERAAEQAVTKALTAFCGAQEAARTVQRALVAADAERLRVRQAYEAARAHNQQVESQRASLDQRLTQARLDWKHANSKITGIQVEVNPFQALGAEWLEKVHTLETERETSRVAVAGLQEQMAVLDWWDAEFPRFKTWLFDSVVDTLAAEANRWIRVMTGGVVWIQISTQRATVKGGLKDEIDVRLHRWNPDGTITCRPYRVWSGGEKRRVALAVDLGLSRLMARRASKPYRFLALDETDRHLDGQGREGLRQVLEELRRERETILIITHDPEFRASFDRQIRVTKRSGTSTLEVASEGKEPQEEDEASNPGGDTVQAEVVPSRGAVSE